MGAPREGAGALGRPSADTAQSLALLEGSASPPIHTPPWPEEAHVCQPPPAMRPSPRCPLCPLSPIFPRRPGLPGAFRAPAGALLSPGGREAGRWCCPPAPGPRGAQAPTVAPTAASSTQGQSPLTAWGDRKRMLVRSSWLISAGTLARRGERASEPLGTCAQEPSHTGSAPDSLSGPLMAGVGGPGSWALHFSTNGQSNGVHMHLPREAHHSSSRHLAPTPPASQACPPHSRLGGSGRPHQG